MSENAIKAGKHATVSDAPFAIVGSNGKCPSCGWTPRDGGLCDSGGITLVLRIHCYREHGLRLTIGARSRLPAMATAAIDLDAEFAAHMWVIDRSVRNWRVRPRDEVMQAARMALLKAILLWDKQKKGGAFPDFAWPLIRAQAGRAAKNADTAAAKAASPRLRMLRQPLNPADIPPATAAEVIKASRCLTYIQRAVLGLRFCVSPTTLRAIGMSIGVSQERVRQIEKEALHRLHEELTNELGGPRGKKRRVLRSKRQMVGLGQSCPGRFVVLWDGVPTRMDCFCKLRLAESSVSVFTDRCLAARAAHNLNRIRKSEAGKPAAVVADYVETSGLTAELVDAFPNITRRSMTVDAIRSELAKHGPMTTAQIAKRLTECDEYMRARHPRLRNVKDIVLHCVMAHVGSVPSVQKSRDTSPVYSLM